MRTSYDREVSDVIFCCTAVGAILVFSEICYTYAEDEVKLPHKN